MKSFGFTYQQFKEYIDDNLVCYKLSKRKVHLCYGNMDTEDDPNVLYGGDPEEYGPLMGNCVSLGELIINDLRTGGDRKSFVSKIIEMKFQVSL